MIPSVSFANALPTSPQAIASPTHSQKRSHITKLQNSDTFGKLPLTHFPQHSQTAIPIVSHH
ncbi:hypothetical protein H6F47_08160 [Sphaerospermopsis sp. FACHB-1094]|uniref:hypothetical protein n=1 Tax=Sphaerospermopsis sp. FACHB-1094 TaxID=2692861 RepID=UPI0019C8CF1C|nr:hypothetical protein [Sphaerospermopsis sp. FACHB-1094]MBD2132406.1 hypothetical protein [Sphaerospermopsis sp. FACHB-1094]